MIEILAVSKKYTSGRGRITALADISFSVGRGAKLCPGRQIGIGENHPAQLHRGIGKTRQRQDSL